MISPAAASRRGSAAASAASSSRPSTRGSSRSTPATGQPIPGSASTGVVDLRKGLRIAPDRVRRLRGHLAARDRRQHDRRGIGHRRRHVQAAPERRSARLRCGDRAAEVDLGSVPQDPAAVGADIMEEQERGPHRRRQCLVGDRRGSRAQSRLRPHEQPEPRLLRRRAPRRQPVRQLRSWRCAPTPARASGISRPFITICGTTTWRRRRFCSTGARTAGRSPRSVSPPRPATCSSSIARPGTPLIPVEERAGPEERRAGRSCRRRRSRSRLRRRRWRARR